MKINCNFLPQENRAFILEWKAFCVAIGLYVLSAFVFLYVFRVNSRESGELEKKMKVVKQEQMEIRQEREQMQYPQDRIQRLIDQFSFIQKAMGAKDFPWLRFFQSIEDSIPMGESGRRGVYLTRMVPSGEKNWQMEGVAEDWKDATRFEELLLSSTYASTGQPAKRNFSDVRLVNYRAVDGGRGYAFRIELSFVDSF